MTTEIEIPGAPGWRVAAEEYSWALQTFHTPKRGEPYWRAVAWYPTLVQALEAVIDRAIKDADIRRLSGTVSLHRKLVEEIKEVVGER